MRILITAGPTREPIDGVRYLSNRSSGRMGISLATASHAAGHTVTLILGPVALPDPAQCRVLHVETAQQMHDAVLAEFTNHDLLIMAAAVADYRPVQAQSGKISREGKLLLELEATPDILAAAGLCKGPNQRTVGFSLEERGNLDRARRKLREKHLDLIVFNPIETLDSPTIEATLLWPDGRSEQLPSRAKQDFADILLQRCVSLMDR